MLWCTSQYKIGSTKASIRCKLTCFCQNLVSQFQPFTPSRVRPGVSLPTRPSWLGQSRSHNSALASGSNRRLHLLQPKTHLNHRSEGYEDVTQQRSDSLRQISLYVTFYDMYFFLSLLSCLWRRKRWLEADRFSLPPLRRGLVVAEGPS